MPPDEAAPRKSTALQLAREGAARYAVPLLLSVFAALALASLPGDSATFDETAYIASGFTQLDRGDFRLNRETPPLAPMICMAPLVLFRAIPVDYESSAWKTSNQYLLGYEMLNGPANATERRDPTGILLASRIPMVFLGLALGLIVYFWTKEMWGLREARVALFLYAFSPTILAHTRLVTMDVPAGLGFMGALWAFWRYCRQPGWIAAVVLGLALGAALLMKHSMVTLVPILFFLLILWAAAPEARPQGWRDRLLKGTAALVLAGVVAAHVVWLVYDYSYSPSPDPDVRLNWDLPGMQGFAGSIIGLARRQQLLPETYLYGVLWQASRAPHEVFLNGAISTTGWGYYFTEAFLLKTTPSLLLLAGSAVLTAIFRNRGLSANGWFLLLPCLYLFYLTSSKGVNIGQRYLLPVYPALFMAAGLCVRAFDGSTWKTWAVGILLGGHAISSLTAFPRYLSYFNLFAGGATNGWKYLVDSNIDWGQDLRRLKSWMDDARVSRVHLAYFGTGDPRAYGIAFDRIQVLDWLSDTEFQPPRKGDYLAVSVTLLQGLGIRQQAVRAYLEKVRTTWTPIAKAGDSIFIYRAEE